MKYILYSFPITIYAVTALLSHLVVSTEIQHTFQLEKKTYETKKVEAVAGQAAKLPCNMTVARDDLVYLVLWFKEGLAKPIYTYDVRELRGGEPKHWWDTDVLGGSRPFFNAHSRPSHLLLRMLTLEDGGLYKCRVDFKTEPTRNTRVNLTVVVPPRHVIMLDSEGNEIRGSIGPVTEGDNLTLSCIAEGGIPHPKLVWLLSERVVDDKIDFVDRANIRNDFRIDNVSRTLLQSKLTCQASHGTAYKQYLITSTVDMYLPPLDVRIHPPVGPLSAGKSYEILCSSAGSRPPAFLTWHNDTQRLIAPSEETSADGNVSSSVLKLSVSSSHNKMKLSCKAENRKIQSAVYEDTLSLQVYYRPEVMIRLAKLLDPKNIYEGNDVFFTCETKSNPNIYKVEWKHNGKLIGADRHRGILLTNDSLVLQKVTKANSGKYTCMASNVEGDGESLPMELRIQYAPICRIDQKIVYGVSKFESVHIKCEVDSVPQSTKFRWWFNNTAETLEVPATGFTVAFGGRSVLAYTPASDSDYGSLLCQAENSQGKQKIPCLYQIIPTSLPQTPNNCSVVNVSTTGLAIVCDEGFNGGLNQTFIMEVYTTKPHFLYQNITASVPRFQISGLEADTEVQLIIYSGNSKGRSGITRLVVYTLEPPVQQLETRVETEESSKESSYLPTIIGAVTGGILLLIFLTVIVIIFVKITMSKHRNTSSKDEAELYPKMHTSPDNKFSSISSSFMEDNCCSSQRKLQAGLKSQKEIQQCQLLDYNISQVTRTGSNFPSPGLVFDMADNSFRDIPPPYQYASAIDESISFHAEYKPSSSSEHRDILDPKVQNLPRQAIIQSQPMKSVESPASCCEANRVWMVSPSEHHPCKREPSLDPDAKNLSHLTNINTGAL